MRGHMVFQTRQFNQPMNYGRFEQPHQIPAQRFNGFQQDYLPAAIQNTSSVKSSISNLATKGVGGLSKTLTNVQQVLKVIESTAPLIEQYGPMVKNLPAMYRMLKTFKEFENMDDTPENDALPEPESSEELVESEAPIEKSIPSVESDNIIEYKRPRKDGQSTPKLFI